MNKLFRVGFIPILLTTLIATIYLKFNLSFIGITFLSLIVFTTIISFFLKKKILLIVAYSLILAFYIGFWFDLNLLKDFTFNGGSVFPIALTVFLPLIGFGLYASPSDSGFRGSLQIRARYKMQDEEIVRKVNTLIVPYSLLCSSILTFPLIFYFPSTFKNLISFIILCLAIIFIEIYIRILMGKKKRKDKKEMSDYIENIKSKNESN